MVAKECLAPAAGMAAHTLLCMLYFVATRVAVIQSKAMHPNYWKVADPKFGTQPEWAIQASNHYKNLFETPVLFYAMCIAGCLLDLADPTFVGVSWLYLAARMVHSAIHLSYNKPQHRMIPFTISLVALAYLILRVLWAAL